MYKLLFKKMAAKKSAEAAGFLQINACFG